ncbi:MAG: PHP domain-containing protein [Candidatus Saccharibacteria bacterium]|nr:PHP domain-containing protein [Candidatus Saccharibacteria bacterium]
MFKTDLHTHSEHSYDGGITLKQYQRTLEDGVLDYIAITDHNRIDFAQKAREALGDRIIVGEEIMTTEGEIIGLFLTNEVRPHQTPADTISAIKQQNGIVYVPHPFETVRKGLHPETIEKHTAEIDLIEVCNGRAFLQNRGEQALVWSRINNVPGAASSDAHGHKGLGKTYSDLAERPGKNNVVELIKTGQLITNRPSMRALLYPKLNRAKKKIKKGDRG